MRYIRLPAALLLAALLAGCDEKGASTAPRGVTASSPSAGMKEPSARLPVPGAKTAPVPGALVASPPPPPAPAAVPGGADAGRVLFDGDDRTGAGGAGGGAVFAGSPSGAKAKTIAYTGPGRKDTLKISEPPPPGGGPGSGKAGDVVLASFGAGGKGGGPGGSGLPGSGSGRCPADMVELPGFCVDRYEYPNRAGAKPLAARTAIEGEGLCRSAGKRLCREDEWGRACRGASGRKLPYAGPYRRGRCNDDKTWKLVTGDDWRLFNGSPDKGLSHAASFYQADPSGSRRECVSEEGVYDLLGNVAEWTAASPGRRHSHVMKGGFWSGHWNFSSGFSCGLTNTAHPGRFRSYEAGFRCCTGLSSSS